MKTLPIQYIIILPLAAAFLTAIFGKRVKGAGDLLACLAAFCGAALSCLAAISVISRKVLVYKIGLWMPPAGIPLVIDALSAFILSTVNIVAFAIAVYSVGYMKKYTDKWKFYTLFSIMLAGINGVLMAGDIFNLYVFLEMASISGYFLVAFGIEPEELEATFKYAVMGSVASIFILLGIAFLYSHVSTLNMADIALVLQSESGGKALLFVSALFLMGFGLKASAVPFHAWLPYAHSSAPAPVSAMLSGVSIKVLGVYALARIFFNIFGMTSTLSLILIIMAVLSMFLGSILAFGQSDIKRLFAYSSIGQIGYIMLGLGLNTPLGILGALFYLLNHSLFKSLLFLNSGSIENLAGTRDLREMSGLAKISPVTGYTSLAAALSISGIPPLGGFWSKLIIILACLQANRPVLALIACVVGVLTLAYYFKALTPVLFGNEKIYPGRPAGKISITMAVSMLILASLTIISAFMLLPNAGNSLLKDAAAVLADGRNYANMVIGALK